MSSTSRQDITWVGLDVHKISIAAAVVRPGRDATEVTSLMADEASVRKFFSHLGPPERLRACYEAGPTGYDLQRRLAAMGISCLVAATPSLIPRAPGDKVKTDRRGSARLVRLLRSGDLVAIRVPTRQEEAVRDLCRARADMVEDLTRARLGKFLLRHGEVWAGASAWTLEHRRWLGARHFEEKALELTFGRYMAVMEEREADLDCPPPRSWCPIAPRPPSPTP